MTHVKICGVRRVEDALLAASVGAHAVGVLVGRKHASPDFVDAELAAAIIRSLPPFCTGVMVTHWVDPGRIADTAQTIGVHAVQLHGGSPSEVAERLRKRLPYLKLIQAVHVTGPETMEAFRPYLGSVDAILLDTANPATGQVGGTGLVHDWNVSRAIVQACPLPVILAGGLNPGNVADAIRFVRPYAVDVNSGVKGEDGSKDEGKLRAFVDAAVGDRF